MTADMHRAWQIFRKDTERLWRVIVLNLALLVFWCRQESTGSTFSRAMGIPQGTWMNIALPFAWSLLIAAAVSLDSPVGDRRFWIALPCGWRPLILAKAAFLAAYIHIPYFAATAAILLARGFNPAAHLPQLLWKQAIVVAVTLPAFAAATLVKNLAQFLLLTVTAASGVVLLSSRINLGNQMDMSWDVRWKLALIVLGSGALVVSLLQFSRRRTIHSRTLGIFTAIAAASLYTWLPRDTSAALYAALAHAHPTAPSVGMASTEPDYNIRLRWYNNRRTTVLIPIAFGGLSAAANVRFQEISLNLTASGGQRYEAEWRDSSDSVKQDRIEAMLDWPDPIPGSQVLEFDNPAVWNRLQSGKVTIRGRILARFYGQGDGVTVRPGDRDATSEVSHCSTEIYPVSRDPSTTVSALECESPEIGPEDMRISPVGPGHVFSRRYLSEHRFYAPSLYPDDPWLSPLHRGMEVDQGSVVTWVVTPQTLLGSAIIDYVIPNLDLTRFVLAKPVKPEDRK